MEPNTSDKNVLPGSNKRSLKVLGTILLLAVFSITALFVINRCLGDIRPALLPPPQDITDIIEKQYMRPPAVAPEAQNTTAPSPLQLPPGFRIAIFARQLGAPRDLELSPGGTLLVSLPGAGKVLALPDINGDGKADDHRVILQGLTIPHGLAFYRGKLFVAEETQVVRYTWQEATLTATRDRVLFQLPPGGRHVSRSLVFNKSGQLFVAVGSTCDVCFEEHPWLGAVITSDSEGNNPRLYAKGLRNSVFLAVNPRTDEVWAGDMGRDLLGDDLPPEEINIIGEGKNYGWPICYGDKIHDTVFDKNTYLHNPCASTEAPIFIYQPHAAPLGLTFITSRQFPQSWQGDLLVAFHGSWNRSKPVGFKVTRFSLQGNAITGAEDFLTGFLQESRALGRPVDVLFDKQGRLYVSDDKAGAVYRIVKK